MPIHDRFYWVYLFDEWVIGRWDENGWDEPGLWHLCGEDIPRQPSVIGDKWRGPIEPPQE